MEAWKPLPMPDYAITQPFSLMKYLQLLSIPVGQSIDHGIHPASSVFEPQIFLSWLVLIAVIVAAVRLYRQRSLPAKLTVFYLTWFALTIAPTTSILPTTAVMVENRLYLPGLAWAGMFGLMYFLLWQWVQYATAGARTAVMVILGLHLCVLSALLVKRNDIMSTRLKVWTDVVRQYPKHDRAHLSLAHLYYDEIKDYDKAREHYLAVVKLYEEFNQEIEWTVHNNLGTIYAKQGELAQAIEEYLEELKVNPKSSETHKNLANAYYETKQYEQAIAEYKATIALGSKCEEAYYNLGVIYWEQGNAQDALAMYSKVSELNPENIDALNNSAACYIKMNRLDLALANLQKVVDIDPQFTNAYQNMLNIYQAQHQTRRRRPADGW